jgi:lipopolysaccharide/colanic/teichoic acid biosynthesis glycosyltransferase
MIYRKLGKRALDLLLAFFGLLLLSPILLVTAILVRIKLGSPILFTQERPGKNAVIFKMYKFRSMTNKKDAEGHLLPDAERLTSFGKILRATSLDELPELWNILRGNMSIIGPRPLLVEYLPHYDEVQKRRHEVRPGLTGLAQVNGRNATTWDERFKFDVEYVDAVSFVGDLKIIYATLCIVFKRQGITAENNATMESFIVAKERKTVTVKHE